MGAATNQILGQTPKLAVDKNTVRGSGGGGPQCVQSSWLLRRGTGVQGGGTSWGCLSFLRCSFLVPLLLGSCSGASAGYQRVGGGSRGAGARALDKLTDRQTDRYYY